ncbi:hypothetical protein [Collinsella sp. BIOML-A5]|uniref:hypothetical protein n=1 Tax=Collinsella sp. BIOML-A5 TaxID=2584632 RepID=UPI001370AA79|nr:hypothetical protein [Collinsella sp. BIOML-A5]
MNLSLFGRFRPRQRRYFGTDSETRQSEQGALKRSGIDLLVMPLKLKGRLPLWRVCSVN